MRYLYLAALSALVVASPAYAASAWDGTWKADLKAAQYDAKPDIWTLSKGVYDCPTCAPALKVAADGKVHTVSGRDYADAMSVTIVDPKTVKSAQYKKGVMFSESTRTLSDDGKTLTTNWRSSLNATGEWKSGTAVMTRTGAAPKGAHAVSGKWVPVVTEATQIPESNLTATIAATADSFTFKSAAGESYTAKFGGSKVAITGDKVGSMVSVKKVSDTVVEETIFVNGKATSINTMTLTDQQTIVLNSNDLRAGFNDKMTFRKQ